jgi:UDP-N-acetylmuramate--alanine ligase
MIAILSCCAQLNSEGFVMANDTTRNSDLDSAEASAQSSGGAFDTQKSFFFCGLGGSGMLPLAQILKGLGHNVQGSDRSYDQGRSSQKFAWLKAQGFHLFPQDGSGIQSSDQILIASAAVEDTVPEMQRAAELGCTRMTRAEALSELFNSAGYGIAIGGTSGKSTVTAMTGWMIAAQEYDPTIMNGAVMKNFKTPENPFASAQVGRSELFVSEVDESDGSIALYRPTIGVLLNISLDHKSMEELRRLFQGFLDSSAARVVNFDDAEVRQLTDGMEGITSFGIESQAADITVLPGSIQQNSFGLRATIVENDTGDKHMLNLAMPGLHNLSNALAALAVAKAASIPMAKAVDALGDFDGLARRYDVIGVTGRNITVIDDFGHNPEKCAATLRTVKATEGRVIAFFQPHGYGPLRQMGDELADTFVRELDEGDVVIMCDPVYFGGTVDRSEGTERIITQIVANGRRAEYLAKREACGVRITDIAQPDDRIVVMGARDDTLTDFAKMLMERLI